MGKEIMSEDTQPVDLAVEVFRHELKAGESIKQLFSEFSEEEATDSMCSAFEQIMENIDDPKKAESTVGVMELFARQMDSEKMMRSAIDIADNSGLVDLEEGGEGQHNGN
jgi:hypothetical protein